METPTGSAPTESVSTQVAAVDLTPGQIVPGVGLSDLALGSSREAALEALGPPSETDQNEFVPGQSLLLYHDRGIELTFQDDQLEVITVHADYEPWSSYRGGTEASVGVGSTAAEVLEAYGPPSEETPEALRYPEKGLWFRLDGAYPEQPEKVRVESLSLLSPN